MAEENTGFNFGQVATGVASGAANGILGQVFGSIFGKSQDKRQVKQQQKLNDIAEATNKRMISYSNAEQEAMQKRMFDMTNLPAQVKLAKEAGMSISSLYGGSGAGGTTVGTGGAGGGTVSAGSADGGTARTGMGLQMAQQIAMQQAQIDNLNANTEKTQAEAETQKVNLTTTKETQEATIDRAIMESLKAKEEWTKAIAESQELNRGLENRLAIISAEATGKALQNEATKMGIKVSQAQIEKMAEDVAQGWQKLNLEEKQQAINKFKAEIDANYPGLGSIAGKIVDNVMERTYELIKGKRKQATYEIK